jgi:glycosyltransferase involved in cell wall biosynthesis
MTVGFDLRPALRKPTGVGGYAMALAERMPALAPSDRFVFFSASLRDRFAGRAWPRNARLHDARIPVRLLNLAWNRLSWPPLDSLCGTRLDLVHSPHPLIVPSRVGRHLVTVHDLFFLKRPELTRAEVRRDYAPLVRSHLARADGVIAVSQHTASDLMTLLRVPASRIAVIPNGVDPRFRLSPSPSAVASALERHALPQGFLLYVGSDEPRKNLARLVAAHAQLASRRRDTPPLALVGPTRGPLQDGKSVRGLGYVDTAELRALMEAASALILVSLEEGFGLPVLEAMAAGLPVVCSRGSGLSEVASGAALEVDPLSVEAIARGIETVLTEPRLREELCEAGVARSRQFSWDAAAAATVELYRATLARL